MRRGAAVGGEGGAAAALGGVVVEKAVLDARRRAVGAEDRAAVVRGLMQVRGRPRRGAERAVVGEDAVCDHRRHAVAEERGTLAADARTHEMEAVDARVVRAERDPLRLAAIEHGGVREHIPRPAGRRETAVEIDPGLEREGRRRVAPRGDKDRGARAGGGRGVFERLRERRPRFLARAVARDVVAAGGIDVAHGGVAREIHGGGTGAGIRRQGRAGRDSDDDQTEQQMQWEFHGLRPCPPSGACGAARR